MMNWKEILPRLNGFSTPVFGVSWTPPEPERAVARRVLAYLENKRVLYNLTEYEYPIPCWNSVNEVREKLSTELGIVEPSSHISSQLRGIRAACLQFVNTCENQGLLVKAIRDYAYPAKHWEFIDALKGLRTQVGFRIAALAITYGLDVDEPLASALPAEAEADALPIE